MLTTQRLLTDLWATWRLVDSVRDHCYDLFTYDEKKQLHDLVVMLKSTRTISSSDRQWLVESDANLRAMRAPIAAARPYQPWRQRPRYKARTRA
jgi:hypothetical protein